MNRQVNYITHAHLILLVMAGGYFLLQKLRTDPVNTTSDFRKYTKTTVTASLSGKAALGKTLFMSNCASCHAILKKMTGPSLLGFTEREPWTNRQNVYDWIRNPAAFMQKNEYARNLQKEYGSMMTAFPNLTNDEIDAICDYTIEAYQMNSIPVAINELK